MMNLNYREFCEQLCECVQRILGDEFKVRLNDVVKVNNVQRTGLVFHRDGENMSPTIYLEGSYNEFCQEEISIEEIAVEIVSQYKDVKNQFPFNFEMLNENNIIAVAVNTYSNMSLLADVPCRSVSEDYSLFYKYRVGDDCNRGTITINDELAERYGYTEEQLYEIAMRNTPIALPVSIKSMMAALFGDGADVNPDDINLDELYVMSNSENFYGSTALFYPETMSMLSKTFDSKFLVCLPSSIHEWILIATNECPNCAMMTEMIESVNETEVRPEEVLGHTPLILEKNASNTFEIRNY